MQKESFSIKLSLEADAPTAYRAVATRDGIRGWWTTFANFDDNEGSVAEMRFPGSGFFAQMRVVRLDPPRLVHWVCVDAEHPPGVSSDRRDWIGTEITFEIEEMAAGKTQLMFTHIGLPPLECYDTCSTIWDFYIRMSLKSYVENGRGEPARA